MGGKESLYDKADRLQKEYEIEADKNNTENLKKIYFKNILERM